MSADGRIIIVGGGIGGLAAARALSLSGRRSLVVEQASEFAEIGAGIQMGPNGLNMMEALGLRQETMDLTVFPDNLIAMDGVSGAEITRIPLGQEFLARFGNPYGLIHRADLHGVLLRACLADANVELRSGVGMESFADDGQGIDVRLSDGLVEHGAALIGADGLWSRTREAVVGDGAPRVSGHIAYRTVVPIEEIEEQYRHHAMMIWMGPRNHLVQYPLRGGKLFNLVAVFHSDRYVEGWDRQGDPDELHQRFASNCEPVRTLLSKVNAWRMWVLCDREPVANWSKGRATLLGDAAHPMLQYLAQGACMALEDSVILSAELAASPDDPAAAFARYQQRRYLRTGRCQIMARVYGGFYHAEGVARELATQYLTARSVQDGYDSLSWLYGFKAPSQA